MTRDAAYAPVGVCMVIRDEAEIIERAIASVRPYVAEINVLDDGSVDGTLEILDRIAAEPGSPLRVVQHDDFTPVEQRDGSRVRERSYALASPKLEWLMWLDADEVLIGGEHLASLFAAAEEQSLDCVKAVMQLGDTALWRERLTRRGAGEWRGFTHAVWSGRDSRSLFAHPAAFLSVHTRPLSTPGRWLARARLSVERGDPHGLVALGGELFVIGDLCGAADAFAEYLRSADRKSFDRMHVTAARWLGALLRELRWPEEAAKVEAALTAYRNEWRDATSRGQASDLDALDALDDALPALLRIPTASVRQPVFAVA